MFTVLSVLAICLFFTGYASASFLRTSGGRWEQAALTLGSGLLINYTVLLTGLSMTLVLAVGAALALAGALRFFRDVRHLWTGGIRYSLESTSSVVAAAYILVIYSVQILSEPLLRWDARSVWFFHAKIIWTEGALRRRGGWTHPSIEFSHPDYPNLIPGIGAQLGHIQGYWNEFLPKGSLVIALLPLVLWVFSFRRRSLSFVLLVALFFFSLHAWLWNGYMDAYLAMYSAVALLSFGRYATHLRDADLYSGVCALGLVASIKNEGVLFCMCAVTALVMAGWKVPEFRFRHLLGRLRSDRVLLIVVLLSLAPTLIWSALKAAWGLQNDILGDLPGGVGRLFARGFDVGTLQYIFGFLITRATPAAWLFGLVILAAGFIWFRRLAIPPGALVATLACMLYTAGLLAIYLITPASVTWHLTTSATRTMAPVSFGLLMSLFFLMKGLEEG